MSFSESIRQLNIVDPKQLRIAPDVKPNRLIVGFDGKQFEGLIPRLPMPTSRPEFVILAQRTREGAWNEVCVIEDYRALDSDSKRALEDVLERNYFIPEILKVERLETSGDEFQWSVVTSKGPRSFSTQGRRNIMVLGVKIIVIDKDDNIYKITDYRKMDEKSLGHLSKFV